MSHNRDTQLIRVTDDSHGTVKFIKSATAQSKESKEKKTSTESKRREKKVFTGQKCRCRCYEM